ncbi:M28 family peptidase [Candidatus Binatia bacterium]|nr:M28 family peptidase [Candidatus Binatia bacterium]
MVALRLLTLLGGFLALAVPVVQAGPVAGDGLALVRVPVTRQVTVRAIAAAGMQPYLQISGADGDYAVAGIVRRPDGSLPEPGLPVHLLDADTTGATYYLATVFPPRPAVDWAAFGRVLHDDGTNVLLRTSAADAERLAAAGAEIAAIRLQPMALPPPAGGAAATLAVTPHSAVQAMLDQVSTAAVTAYEQELTGVVAPVIDGAAYTIRTRHTLSGTPIQKATRYVGARFAARGLSVEYHNWNSATYPNVIGEIAGQTNPADIVVIGAHLDDMPAGSVAPGADDNASGSTAVLIAADVLSQYQWACTLRFALWTGEEQGLLGSRAYAQRAFGRSEAIRGYLNLDMIGYDSSGYGEISLISRSGVPGSEAMMNLFADVIDAYDLDLAPLKRVDDNVGNYSDNASFWTYGYASILAIEGLTYGLTPYYHTTSDTLATLDVPYMTEFAKAALGTFVHLSDCLLNATPTATATPTPSASPSPVPPTPTATPTWAVSGTVSYYAGGHPIANAAVELVGPSTVATTTAADGGYACAGALPGTTTLTPGKHGDTGSAVSALDAAYVLQNVVGIRVFDAQQALACEITGNGALSALDASLILQKTIGLIGSFPVETACGSEWVFVPMPAAAPNQRLVPPVTVSGCQAGAIAYEPLSGPAAGQDFAGVVFGDCSGNWTPTGAAVAGGVAATAARVRSGHPLRRPDRLVVPVVVDAAAPFHAVELELQAVSGTNLARVRRGPAAAGAAVAAAVDPAGRTRIALASAAGMDAERGPLLYVDVRGDRDRAAPPRLVRARIDDGRWH